jgi:hypothetical protein
MNIRAGEKTFSFFQHRVSVIVKRWPLFEYSAQENVDSEAKFIAESDQCQR